MRLDDDTGNVTITAAGAISAVVALVFLVGTFGKGMIDTHQARVAAELAAVAAAHSQFHQEPDPCGVANQVSSRNGGEVIQCDLVEVDVIVTVRVGSVSAASRAGPI